MITAGHKTKSGQTSNQNHQFFQVNVFLICFLKCLTPRFQILITAMCSYLVFGEQMAPLVSWREGWGREGREEEEEMAYTITIFVGNNFYLSWSSSMFQQYIGAGMVISGLFSVLYARREVSE